MNLAKKYVKDNGTTCENKKYKSFSKSRLFLELCMLESNYQKKDKETLDGVIDGLYMTYSRLCDSAESVLNFDFRDTIRRSKYTINSIVLKMRPKIKNSAFCRLQAV